MVVHLLVLEGIQYDIHDILCTDKSNFKYINT